MAPLMEPISAPVSDEKKLRLLAIEKELVGEGDIPPNQALEKYDAVLLNLAARLKRVMDAGLPPDEFEKCSTLNDAVTTARKIIRLTK